MVSGGARSAPESNHRDDLRGSTPLALLAPLTMTEKSARRRGDYDGVFERAEHYWNPSEEDRRVMVSGGARSAPESNHRDDRRGSAPLALLAPLTMTEKSARRRGDYDGVFERAEHYWNPFEEDRLVAVSGGARRVSGWGRRTPRVMVSGGARSAPESNHNVAVARLSRSFDSATPSVPLGVLWNRGDCHIEEHENILGLHASMFRRHVLRWRHERSGATLRRASPGHH